MIESFRPAAPARAVAAAVVTLHVEARVRAKGEMERSWSVDGVLTGGPDPWLQLRTGPHDPPGRTVSVEVRGERTEATTLFWRIEIAGSRASGSPPAVVTRFLPGGFDAVTSERFELSVIALDNDVGEIPVYRWAIDGSELAGNVSALVLEAGSLQAGRHIVSATVEDQDAAPGDPADVVLFAVNVVSCEPGSRPPVVRPASPPGFIRIQTGSGLGLSIEVEDPDGDPLTHRWEVDGERRRGDGRPLVLDPEALRPGTRLVRVVADDGGGPRPASAFDWRIEVVSGRLPAPPAHQSGTIELAWDG